MADLSAIIVNFNARDLLKDCVDNLLETGEFQKIVVVDNDSIDGSVELIENKFGDELASGEVKLIKTLNNGLAAGNNLGLAQIDSKYVLYIGSDCYPTKDAIQKCVAFMEKNADVGISTAKLVMRDGTLDWHAHRGFSTPWAALTYFAGLSKFFPKSKLFNQYFLGFKDFSKPHEIDLCITHFMLVRADANKKVGKWDEDYFLFGEDVDFCYRMKQLDYKIMYLSDIEVLHIKGASMGRKSAEGVDTVSKKLEITKKIMSSGRSKAQQQFYEKHYRDKYPWILTSIVLLGIFLLEKLRVVLSAVSSKRS